MIFKKSSVSQIGRLTHFFETKFNSISFFRFSFSRRYGDLSIYNVHVKINNVNIKISYVPPILLIPPSLRHRQNEKRENEVEIRGFLLKSVKLH